MTFRRALIVAMISAVVLTGCGAAEKLSPRMAVKEAAKTTASQKEGTFTLSLVGSEADLNTLFNEGAPLSQEDREGLALLRNGHIALSTAADKFGLDIKAGDLEHAFELRYVDKKLFARADVAGLAKLFGASPEQVNETVLGLASQDGLGFVSAAAAGKWIVADFSALKGMFDGLGKQFGLEPGESTPAPSGESTPTSDPKAASEYKAIKDAIAQALNEDVAIDKLKSDDAGDHYLAKVASLRNFYAKVRPVFETQMGKLPFGQDLPAASAIPDKPGALDIWVKSGRISRLELDLAQFAPAPPAGAGRVALRLDIAREAASVTVPPDAVPVDLAGLVGKFMGQFGNFLQGVGAGMSNYD
jgi:hypothetical protein